MKKGLLTALALAVFGIAMAQQQGNHWTPVGLEHNMTVSGIILIDGEEQMGSTLEVGAFCGEQCRGSRRGTYFNMTGQYVVPLQIQGNSNGEIITFRLYDHVTQQELELESVNTLEFEINGRLGTPDNWYPFAFITPATPPTGFHFITAGNWSNASNWQGGALPEAEDMVFIDADCTLDQDATVAALTVSETKTLTLATSHILTVTGTLTNTATTGFVIADGAQLITNGSVTGTMQKNILGYNNMGDWNFIAPPVDSVSPIDVDNMLDHQYDLYYFDQSEELEWINYKVGAFGLTAGKGYLYANSDDVVLSFAGELNTHDGSVTLDYVAGSGFIGWNLVGNPYPCNAYLADNRPFYVMNISGNEIIAAVDDVIQPMQGIFVVTTQPAGEEIAFTKTSTGAKKQVVLNLIQGRNSDVIDRAIVRFDEGGTLGKFMLNKDNTKLYFSQNDKNYAVVCQSIDDASPICFKASHNDTYTLSVDIANLDLDYLHLIDKKAGVDVDLLQTPNYTFEAYTNDNAERFQLVYATTTGGNEAAGSFAYYHDGEIRLVETYQGASLQVVDMMGREVVSYVGDAMNCISTNGMAKGVYVLRLFDCDNVKTQKIVVR